MPERSDIRPWVRILVMLLAVSAAAWLSFRLTGSALPTEASASLIFQNALLLVVLGSAIGEHKFTTPSDAILNALAGIITLLGVYYIAPTKLWWFVFSYCVLVFTTGTVCVAVSEGPTMEGWRRRVADITFRPATRLGQARLLFSVLFLFALFSFYSARSQSTAELVLFWGLFVVLWPLGVLEWLSSLGPRRSLALKPEGQISRFDWPNLIRVRLSGDLNWRPERVKLFQQADGSLRIATPLYSQSQDKDVIGTAICIGEARRSHQGLLPGAVYDAPPEEALSANEIAEALGADGDARLIGFVVEDSDIAALRFETWDSGRCSEGMLVFAVIDKTKVYYQVTDGCTAEESLHAQPRGFQVATAAQLGTYDRDLGFRKFPWLPTMNAPIFRLGGQETSTGAGSPGSDFVYGTIPGTAITVSGDLMGAVDHHIALLGVTGSGKTELAFDMIRHAVNGGAKVLCFDLTARYCQRLRDLNPQLLALPPETSAKLGALLFEAETGKFGATEEKKVLKDFTDKLRSGVRSTLEGFLADRGASLGIVTLEEISNTKATLAVTELYLSTILRLAIERNAARERILVVLEEAHTIVPEPSTMGLGDYDSRGVVAKIAQIALQGRKYGVGLLVIAQRTATVSKSILTQCNTVVSFACIDDTSIGFLGNVFGNTYARLLPNLPRLRAIVAGKGVRGDRPLVFEVPFNAKKAADSDEVDGRRGGVSIPREASQYQASDAATPQSR